MCDKRFLSLLAALCTVLLLAVATHAQQTPTAGDLIINEIMYNPSSDEPGTEWFEVKNVSANELNINGCTISDNQYTHTVSGAPNISSGDYYVIGHTGSTGVTYDYAYGSATNIQLANGGDTITITCTSTTIDEVIYDGSSPWPSDTNGRAIAFGIPTGGGTDYTTLNDNGDNWEHSTSEIGGSNSDRGTPGAVNDDVLGANAITLRSLSARPISARPSTWPPAVLAGAVALAGLLWAKRRRLV